MHTTTFRDYWFSLTIDERKAFAARCGASYNYFMHYAYGQKQRLGAEFAINAERESKRRVRCETERPDIDWNAIRGTPKSRIKRRPARARR